MIFRFFLCFAMLTLGFQGIAQDKPPLASLVADVISVDEVGRVTASGNVVVFYDGKTVTANSVTYDRNGETLNIEGPLRVTDGNGTILIADQASLDRDLQNGILLSARMVLDQQLQLAADEIRRIDGRYTQLDQVVASSCEVCAKNPIPLWEIRSDRVVHDQEQRQLYFTNAQMRVVGIPIFYTPRLRLPDPTLDRSTGFMIPRLKTSSVLGTGLKLPYFITLGDHADVTLTPYLSTTTTTVELEFRQKLAKGGLQARGAWTNDDIEGPRGYLFANGTYQLPKGFQARARLELASDAGYLFQYGYSDKDRLSNQLSFNRIREKDFFLAELTEFRTFRESEIPIRDTLPDQFIDVVYIRELPSLSFGGKTTATIDAAALNRPSSIDIDGRDVSRIGVGLDWRKDQIWGPGILTAIELGARVDAYNIGQDSNFDTNLTRFIPRTAVEFRWPWARATKDNGHEIFEPVVRLDIADADGDTAPLEDSRVIEFDEANLFSMSRYPGRDGVEDGARIAAGLAWRRDDPDGWQLDVALGRIAHLDGELGFSEGSGLEGDKSEWLLAAKLELGTHLWLMSRSLFSEELDFTLSETRLNFARDNFDLASSFIFAQPEPAEGRNDPLSEWSFNGSYEFSNQWNASADWRYDFEQGRAARVGVGLGYKNECVDLSLSLSRRYATSTSVDPTTEFGFRVSLAGVGGNEADRKVRRACRG